MGMILYRCSCLTSVVVAMLAFEVSARCDELLVIEPAQLPPPLKLVRLGALNAGRATVHHIDHLVYGTAVNYGQLQIEHLLGNKIFDLSTEYDLTPAQQAKLKLAAQREARQFVFEVDQLRRNYDAAKGDTDGLRLFTNEAESLRKKRLRLFGTNSFLSKVTAKTVTDEQVMKHESTVEDRMRLRHRSNIEGAIRDIERHVVLKISQHEALVDLLINEIPHPKSISDFDETLVKYRFSTLPEQKLKPLFDADLWPSVRQILDGFQEFEPILTQQGLIGKESVEAIEKGPEKSREEHPASATR